MAEDLRLNVVGWRHLTHSFAIVNQWQLLSLDKQPGLQLTAQDAPLPIGWRPRPGMFGAEQTAVISGIPMPSGDVDTEYRIRFPFDLTVPSDDRRVLSFCVTEGGVFADDAFVNGVQPSEVKGRVRVVTPSTWSRDLLIETGADPQRIEVVPHGVDISTFRPDEALRENFRARLGISGFAFLNVSAMVGTKGIGTLLKAFAVVLESGAEATLVLKGNDSLYSSQRLLRGSLEALSEARRELVLENLVYLGQPFDMSAMAGLYNAADAYVSPYHAEGFNMPVLEAAAAGLPLICTGGGSTDDFTTDAFRRKIEAAPGTRPGGDRILVPDAEHLADLMRGLIDDHHFVRQARSAGPEHAATNYSWDRVAELLVAAARRA